MGSIPATAQIEAGIASIDENRNSISTPSCSSARKRSRGEGVTALVNAIYRMAERDSAPQSIVIHNVTSSNASDVRILSLERATKVASTVGRLMELETKTMSQLDQLPVPVRTDDSSVESTRELLSKRLRRVRRTIDSVMSIGSENEEEGG